ncbi:hypothetical protein [Emticicia sp. W12TSBA100-4]|uniref:hypothetical protein n=1 Tax=Emticicia sp. W12TSBA100-4 TaxID=3160965 RepID=UPI0033059E24
MKRKIIIIIAVISILFFKKELKYYTRFIFEMGKVQFFSIDSYPNEYIITNAPKDNKELLKIITPFVLSEIERSNYQKDSLFVSYYFYRETPNLDRDFKYVEYDEWGWNWNADNLMNHIEDLKCVISINYKNNKEIRFDFHSYNPEDSNFYKYGIPLLDIKQPVWMINKKYFDTTGREILLPQKKVFH